MVLRCEVPTERGFNCLLVLLAAVSQQYALSAGSTIISVWRLEDAENITGWVRNNARNRFKNKKRE
jgi:hypothetical protein